MKISRKEIENAWRRGLLSFAHGKVLEISIGTGINFKYYPLKVLVTATDVSAKVLDKARQRAIENGVNAEFILSPIDDLKLAEQSFDTIVSTFSLGSYEDPVEVLRQFNKWCKPGGTILLMEYGISDYRMVRWLQSKWEPYHYRETGCHITLDMKSVIERAQLCIKKMERKCGGIIYLVWAAPKHPGPKNNITFVQNSKIKQT